MGHMMKSIRATAALGILAISLCFAVGCGGTEDVSDEGLVPTSGAAATGPTLTEVKSDGTGTIAGTVTYDGEPPAMGVLPGIEAQPVCMQGEIHNQAWVVDASSKGVSNVVVWVEPPKGQYFKKPEQKFWEDAVQVDQPFCAFIPHVVALFPQAFNGMELEPTGQVLRVKNSAPIAHNIRVAGSPRLNSSRGGILTPKTGVQDFTLNVDKQEIGLNCDIHKWMTGYAVTFDHPYSAVTDKDGKFTIKNVPAGAELKIGAWHESLKKFSPEVAGGVKVKLNKDQALDASFKVHAK
jgi:hypothetical protein